MGSHIKNAIAAAVQNTSRKQGPDPAAAAALVPHLDDGPGPYHAHLDTTSNSSTSCPSTSRGNSSSPTRLRRDSLLDRVPEEEHWEPRPVQDDDEAVDEFEEEVQWELEHMGLYRGSYSRLTTLFSIVPLSSLFFLIILATLPPLFWPLPRETRFPSYHDFPFPLPELLTSMAIWSLSHAIHISLYSLFSSLTRTFSPIVIPTLLTTTTHVFLTNVLRLSCSALLHVRHEMDYPLPTWLDNSFRRVTWIAIGWSIAEVGVSVVQGYEMIGIYKGVMVPPGRETEFVRGWKDMYAVPGITDSPGPLEQSGYLELEEAQSPHTTIMPHKVDNAEFIGGSRRHYLGKEATSAAAIRLQLEQDLDQLLALKAREEVEEVYGMPAITIPVFISTLQRFNSIILSQGLNLLLTAAYLSSAMSVPILQTPPSNKLLSNRPIAITFSIVIILHLLLSILHTPLILPKIGLHTASYVGLIVGLGSLFAGLGVWKALS